MITKKTVLAFVGGVLTGCLLCLVILPHRYELLVSGPSNMLITKFDRLTGATWKSVAGQPWQKIDNHILITHAPAKKPVALQPWEEERLRLAQRDVTKWRQIKKGMTKPEVEAILSKPIKIQESPNRDWETWDYPRLVGSYETPYVTFERYRVQEEYEVKNEPTIPIDTINLSLSGEKDESR
ncbi:MAG: outer membrane protein assembly factor BamE [Verrucomicrobia bacterium]|nr:outer membrane protein assembly factor BamE [Verrucomicrobiota bacterium]MBU1734010.1 outer membrane protein assembly factor BamE [Verrucomicrobiota bacterium]MBU1857106.1 outer membrane protein assembly factor BamE [Verrucomicrobiota bacterium]